MRASMIRAHALRGNCRCCKAVGFERDSSLLWPFAARNRPEGRFFRGLSVRQFCLARCGACRPVAAGSVAGAHCAACGALFCTGALRPLMLMRVMRPCSPLMRIRTRAGCEFCSFMVFLRLFRVLVWCAGKRVFSPTALAMGGFRGCLQFILDVAATRFCTISGYQVVKTYSFSPHPNPSLTA